MITIENTINSAIVYTDSIDPGADGLIRALCGSPISKNSKIRIMPDVHPGKGCAIGTTMTLTNTVAPGLVGTDIGCGMTVCQVSGRRIELQKLDVYKRQGYVRLRIGGLHHIHIVADLLFDGLILGQACLLYTSK